MSIATEYRKLLLQYLPQPIHTQPAYRRALKQLTQLMECHPSAARGRMIEVLSTLVEEYESQRFAPSVESPSQMLAHLLEARGARPADVARQTGISPATLSSVLAGRRGVSKANATRLASFFGVSPLLFLASAEADPAKAAATR
jgi:HTH-type transcriptional regulator/antitoxin HigA